MASDAISNYGYYENISPVGADRRFRIFLRADYEPSLRRVAFYIPFRFTAKNRIGPGAKNLFDWNAVTSSLHLHLL